MQSSMVLRVYHICQRRLAGCSLLSKLDSKAFNRLRVNFVRGDRSAANEVLRNHGLPIDPPPAQAASEARSDVKRPQSCHHCGLADHILSQCPEFNSLSADKRVNAAPATRTPPHTTVVSCCKHCVLVDVPGLLLDLP